MFTLFNLLLNQPFIFFAESFETFFFYILKTKLESLKQSLLEFSCWVKQRIFVANPTALNLTTSIDQVSKFLLVCLVTKNKIFYYSKTILGDQA